VQVLIFSQFKIMLNVLEDFMNLSDYPYERIDGDVPARERQAAIDRFSKSALRDQMNPRVLVLVLGASVCCAVWNRWFGSP